MTTAEQKRAAREFAEYWSSRGSEKSDCHQFWMDLLRSVFNRQDVRGGVRFEGEHVSRIVDGTGKPLKTAGKIDYVAAWYWKATELSRRAAETQSAGAMTRCTFVSTNSICQGELVAAVYNNFPWPDCTKDNPVNPVNPVGNDHGLCDSAALRDRISTIAQAILDARALYPDSSLADLYDDTFMPPELRKAHQVNDAAVLAAYGFSPKATESEIVAKLFEMYAELTKSRT